MADDYLVYIPREQWEKAKRESLLLQCLEYMGVENWEGYEEACRLQEERLEQGEPNDL